LSDFLGVEDRIAKAIDAVELEADLLLSVLNQTDHRGLLRDRALPAHHDGKAVLRL
jgi:hypothetical protein